jgi:hypothetical protein
MHRRRPTRPTWFPTDPRALHASPRHRRGATSARVWVCSDPARATRALKAAGCRSRVLVRTLLGME